MKFKSLLIQNLCISLTIFGYQSTVMGEGKNLLKSSLSISGYSSGDSSFKDNENENFKDSSLGVTYFLPIGSGKFGSESSGMYQNFASFRYSSNKLELSTLDEDHQVEDVSIGGGSLLYSGGSTIYLIAGGVRMNGEQLSSNSSYIGGGGLVGAIYTDDDINWIYGGAFGYVLGKGALFPILGLFWEINEDSSLMTILPALLQYNYVLTEKLQASAFFRIKGNQYGLDLSEDTLDRDDSAYLRSIQVKTGIKLTYRLAKNWKTELELGRNAYGKISIYDGDEELSSNELNRSGYVMLKGTYTFGESIYEKIIKESGWQ